MKNCINFADQFCCLLGVGSVPEWVRSLQEHAVKAGDKFDSSVARLQQMDHCIGLSATFKKMGAYFTRRESISDELNRVASQGWTFMQSVARNAFEAQELCAEGEDEKSTDEEQIQT